MPTYFLTHHFPKDFQGSPETASAATAWFASMGTNLVGRGGNPTVEPPRLGNCGSEQAQLAYTLLSADDLEAAVAVAQAWPLLARGGGVEVRELTLVNPTASVAA